MTLLKQSEVINGHKPNFCKSLCQNDREFCSPLMQLGRIWVGCRYSEFSIYSLFYLIKSIISLYMDYGWMDGFGKSRRILASKRTPKGRVKCHSPFSQILCKVIEKNDHVKLEGWTPSHWCLSRPLSLGLSFCYCYHKKTSQIGTHNTHPKILFNGNYFKLPSFKSDMISFMNLLGGV